MIYCTQCSSRTSVAETRGERRWRRCDTCGHRFTTRESADTMKPAPRKQTRRSLSMSASLYEALKAKATQDGRPIAQVAHHILAERLGVAIVHYRSGTHPTNVGYRRKRTAETWEKIRKVDPLSVEARPPPGKACAWCERPFPVGSVHVVGDMHEDCARERGRVESRDEQRRRIA